MESPYQVDEERPRRRRRTLARPPDISFDGRWEGTGIITPDDATSTLDGNELTHNVNILSLITNTLQNVTPTPKNHPNGPHHA